MQQVSGTGVTLLTSLPLAVLHDGAHRPVEATLVLRRQLTVGGHPLPDLAPVVGAEREDLPRRRWTPARRQTCGPRP